MVDETGRLRNRPLGRPPLEEGEARSRRTVTFLTESEYEQLLEVARRNDMSISSQAHKLLIRSLNSWK